MKPVKQAKRYAKMFLNVVGMEDAPRALVELASIDRLMLRSGEFRSFIHSPGFSQAEKEGAHRKIAEQAKISNPVLKFIIFLTEIRVAGALSEIVKTATAIYLDRKKHGVGSQVVWDHALVIPKAIHGLTHDFSSLARLSFRVLTQGSPIHWWERMDGKGNAASCRAVF